MYAKTKQIQIVMQCKTCSGTSWGRWWLPTNSTDFAYKKNGTDIIPSCKLCLGHGRGTSTTLNWHCRPGKQKSDIHCTILFPLLGGPPVFQDSWATEDIIWRVYISSLANKLWLVRVSHLTHTTGEPEVAASFISWASTKVEQDVNI